MRSTSQQRSRFNKKEDFKNYKLDLANVYANKNTRELDKTNHLFTNQIFDN